MSEAMQLIEKLKIAKDAIEEVRTTAEKEKRWELLPVYVEIYSAISDQLPRSSFWMSGGFC